MVERPPPRAIVEDMMVLDAPITNEPPKSPFQTFVDVLKEELRKNRELQDNVKQLQGDVEKFQDSEAMKRAREAYERARVRIQFMSATGHELCDVNASFS